MLVPVHPPHFVPLSARLRLTQLLNSGPIVPIVVVFSSEFEHRDFCARFPTSCDAETTGFYGTSMEQLLGDKNATEAAEMLGLSLKDVRSGEKISIKKQRLVPPFNDFMERERIGGCPKKAPGRTFQTIKKFYGAAFGGPQICTSFWVSDAESLPFRKHDLRKHLQTLNSQPGSILSSWWDEEECNQDAQINSDNSCILWMLGLMSNAARAKGWLSPKNGTGAGGSAVGGSAAPGRRMAATPGSPTLLVSPADRVKALATPATDEIAPLLAALERFFHHPRLVKQSFFFVDQWWIYDRQAIRDWISLQEGLFDMGYWRQIAGGRISDNSIFGLMQEWAVVRTELAPFAAGLPASVVAASSAPQQPTTQQSSSLPSRPFVRKNVRQILKQAHPSLFEQCCSCAIEPRSSVHASGVGVSAVPCSSSVDVLGENRCIMQKAAQQAVGSVLTVESILTTFVETLGQFGAANWLRFADIADAAFNEQTENGFGLHWCVNNCFSKEVWERLVGGGEDGVGAAQGEPRITGVDKSVFAEFRDVFLQESWVAKGEAGP